MDALQLAKGTMVAYAESVEKGTVNYAIGTWLTDAAGAYAAIAQAEQLQRVADAAERRNELLAEFNADSKTSAAAHTERMAESVNSFLDAHFDKGEES